MYWTINILLCTMISVLGHPTSYPDEPVENEVLIGNYPFVRRSEWKARTPKQTLPLKTPVPYVVIHHSYTPPACYDKAECSAAMRSMQNFHMDERVWWDIGYSFAVGSDGVAYEGRGWNTLGAHSLHFNSVSIGICLIGNWTDTLPPTIQMKTAKALIHAGVEQGYIKPDYRLVGHRQVRQTDCPGQTLYEEIKTWNHHSDFPASFKDLDKIPELIEARNELKNSTGVEKAIEKKLNVHLSLIKS